MDASQYQDTNDAPQAQLYDQYREKNEEELKQDIQENWNLFQDQITISGLEGSSLRLVDLMIEQFETDEKGYVEFDVEDGREYLMDSVIIYSKKGDPEKKEPIWHSIWASTTFLVPERTL